MAYNAQCSQRLSVCLSVRGCAHLPVYECVSSKNENIAQREEMEREILNIHCFLVFWNENIQKMLAKRIYIFYIFHFKVMHLSVKFWSVWVWKSCLFVLRINEQRTSRMIYSHTVKSENSAFDTIRHSMESRSFNTKAVIWERSEGNTEVYAKRMQINWNINSLTSINKNWFSSIAHTFVRRWMLGTPAYA